LVFYHTSHLLYYLTSQTKEFDNYINLEKFISKIEFSISLIKKQEEAKIFRNDIVIILGCSFEKTNNLILSKSTHNFILDLIFTSITENREFVISNSDNLKSLFKNNKIEFNLKDNKSDLTVSEEAAMMNLISDKNFLNLRDNLESFFKYLNKFMTDVSLGKKIWKEVEELLFKKIGNLEISPVQNSNFPSNSSSGAILEIVIIFIFNKCKNCKIILSSIFEFLCDKFNISNYVDIPSIEKNNQNVKGEAKETFLNNGLNLFYEIICNHYEIILTDQILNERYMLYFARIFIEDTLSEILNSKDNEEKFLMRLFEIIAGSNFPFKLMISLISNISKFFFNQISANYEQPNQVTLNIQLLDRIYTKLIIFLNKFSTYHAKEKSSLDRDEFFNIIQNFSTNVKMLRSNYILLFVKFFVFVEFNFKIDLEFVHRKKLYVTVFEMFYELIVNFDIYENSQMNLEEFIKLIELFIIIMKNYSKFKLEDGYLIYKIVAMVIKKIGFYNHNISSNNVIFNPTVIMNENASVNNKSLSKIQICLIYTLVNIVVYLLSG